MKCSIKNYVQIIILGPQIVGETQLTSHGVDFDMEELRVTIKKKSKPQQIGFLIGSASTDNPVLMIKQEELNAANFSCITKRAEQTPLLLTSLEVFILSKNFVCEAESDFVFFLMYIVDQMFVENIQDFCSVPVFCLNYLPSGRQN